MDADALPIARTVEGALGENQVRADAGKGSWPREVMARIVRGTATGFVQPARAAGRGLWMTPLLARLVHRARRT